MNKPEELLSKFNDIWVLHNRYGTPIPEYIYHEGAYYYLELVDGKLKNTGVEYDYED